MIGKSIVKYMTEIILVKYGLQKGLVQMSNAKVERRKQEKYNRKKNEIKRKIKNVLVTIAVSLVILGVVFVVGYRMFVDYFQYDMIDKISIENMYNALTKVESASVEDEKTDNVTATEEKQEDKKADDKKSDEKNSDKKSEDKETDSKKDDKK